MAAILLDTNVVSELMRTQPEQAVMDWFTRRTGDVFYVSAITQAEIMLGIALLPPGKRRDVRAAAADGVFNQDFVGKSLPFEANCTRHYATIVSGRRQAGLATSTEDAQIASIALAHGYPLATRNIKGFLQIDSLTCYRR